MSSTTLALSSAGGADPARSPLNRCTVATSSGTNAYTKVPPVMSMKFSSSTAAGRSSLNNDKMMITSELPLRRCCYSTASASILTTGRGRRRSISCEVTLRSTNLAASSLSSSSTTVAEGEDQEEEQRRAEKKIGAKVRVKVPLKVYHVPRVPEVDLTGKEGRIKQYVGLWKGKRISANLPYKIEFVVDIEGRGPVKFFSHLKEEEFEYLD